MRLIAEQPIMLIGSFDRIIGSNTGKFLQECTDSLCSVSDVKCVHVRPEPIIVHLHGTDIAVNKAVEHVKAHGLKTRNYPTLHAYVALTTALTTTKVLAATTIESTTTTEPITTTTTTKVIG